MTIKERFYWSRTILVEILTDFPKRLRYLFRSPVNIQKTNIFISIGITWFQILDLFGFANIFEVLISVFKPNVRLMTNEEIWLARSIFGHSIDYKKVLIDEKSILGPKQKYFAYVFCNTINSYGKLTQDVFIHELTHIWQYQHQGIGYIPAALKAQYSVLGYNYQGIAGLKIAIATKKGFPYFNYEQQADIVSDYFRITNGRKPRWGSGTKEDLGIYEKLIYERVKK